MQRYHVVNLYEYHPCFVTDCDGPHVYVFSPSEYALLDGYIEGLEHTIARLCGEVPEPRSDFTRRLLGI